MNFFVCLLIMLLVHRKGKKQQLCLLLQEWTRWEDDCGRLSSILDDVEAFISSRELEASDEKLAENRLDLCQVNHRTTVCFRSVV